MGTTTGRSMARLVVGVAMGLGVAVLPWTSAESQSEQRIDVTVKNFTFVTKQAALQLGRPTVIMIKNEDAERHDFGSTMFEGTLTQVESHGAIAYGRGVAGVFLDPKGEVQIRFTMEHPGRYEFRCSIHPGMKGELLLLNVDAV